MTKTQHIEFAFPVHRHNSDVLGGEQYLFKFDNGLGASVVRHRGSYGNELGLWELAAIAWNNDIEWDFFHNDFYEDVKGWLNELDVEQHLRSIAAF